jgi:hypothetical protein
VIKATPGEEWPGRPRGAIGPALIFWFFCIKAKEQEKVQGKRTKELRQKNERKLSSTKNGLFTFAPVSMENLTSVRSQRSKRRTVKAGKNITII